MYLSSKTDRPAGRPNIKYERTDIISYVSDILEDSDSLLIYGRDNETTYFMNYYTIALWMTNAWCLFYRFS